MTTSSSSKSYFDLHTTGLGYVNRVRTVKPKRGGESFLACDIGALNGPRDDVRYCYYDVKVSGQEAQRLIRKCKDAVDAGCKVLIGFKVGDPWFDIFKYREGHSKAGQTGVSQKARLLFIYWINFDGVRVYTAESKAASSVGAESRATPGESGEEVPAADPPDVPASESSEEDAEAPAMAASA